MNDNSAFNFSSNISYLYPREPSLRPGERPGLRQCSRPQKLLFQFGEANKETEDAVKVYLRIKPSDEGMGKLFSAIDDRKLFVDHSRDSTISHKSDQARRHSEQFVFTKILRESIDQSQVFRECALQPLKNFIQGDNCLVFAYGTTNAGKTFTIRGDARNPGIIPRALEYVFSSLGPRVLDEPSLMLVHSSHLEQLSEAGTTVLLNYKRLMLDTCLEQYKPSDRKLTSTLSLHSDTSSDVSAMFQDMEAHIRQDLLSDTIPSKLDEDAQYLVYVSFAEIYNENIYDLLQLSNPRQAYSWRRTPLQLGLDSFGNTYIKDLQHFQVTSGYEAYCIMLFGQHNLRIAGTELNSVSSRSHCIFDVKLVKCTGNFSRHKISTFSFCDLAGSERAKKTLNCGERMKESQNINTSLLVLGRCLTSIRANQQLKEKLPVPFRDSKLTRLFKEPLQRKGCVSIIVNVNLDPYLYDETMNVLKFSAIAREVVLPRKKPRKRMTLFGQHLQKRKQSMMVGSTDGSVISATDSKDASACGAEPLLKLIEKLQEELRREQAGSAKLAQQLRSKERECAAKDRDFAVREDQLRSELVHDFQDSLQQLVARGEATRESLEYRMEEMADFRIRLAEKKYAQKLSKLQRQLKKRKIQDVEDIEEEPEDAPEERLRDCEKRLAGMQQEALSVRTERDALRATVALQTQRANGLQERVSRLELQLEVATVATEDGDASVHATMVSCLRKQLEEVTAQKSALEEQIKLLTATIDSATEDHEEILEEKNVLEEKCYSLEKRLAEKELENEDLNSRLVIYQKTFDKQTQTLELLKKLADDRLEALEEKADYIHKLELRIENLSSSDEKIGTNQEVADLIDLTIEESNEIGEKTFFKENELLVKIQSLEKSLGEKDKDLKSLQQNLETKSSAEWKYKEEATELKKKLEILNKQYLNEIEFKHSEIKKRSDELQTENEELKASFAQQDLDVRELTNRLVDYQTAYSEQSQELELLQKLADDRMEALNEKDKYIHELELRIEELNVGLENEKCLLQQLSDDNNDKAEQLTRADELRTVEAESLQKEIKMLLQRICKLEESIGEKDADLERLQKNLKAEILTEVDLKKEIEALTDQIGKQKREYHQDVTVKEAVMKDRIEQLRIENAELRNSLEQLELDMAKQRSQHETLFKWYEDHLKQKAEEMERYKRDAQHCQELLYKNTPTPNKETQELIKGLRNELHKKDTQMEKLERQTMSPEHLAQTPFKDHFEENIRPSKSTSRKQAAKTPKTSSSKVRSTCKPISLESTADSLLAKAKQKTKKQLFKVDNDSFVDVGEEASALLSKAKETKKKIKSPNTILKRSLRSKP
ncbi:kinesin-like protein KIF20A isoform X2 [Bacillus rossius redtenbacheri]|uniref:kinesin-like protein KIF20A isoform X2 n=1 Tax=Bacillus rossius redtenbacheri TaxID=93214 RepID=UPI002FDDD461